LKTIGLIGGLSWRSSAAYYAIINESVAAALGDPHSARCVMFSFDFQEIEVLQVQGRWDEATARMIDAVQRLERAGAELLVICSNTMHRMAEDVERATSVPLLHIADATAEAIRRQGLSKVGLLGTRFTMEEDFYVKRLRAHGLTVITPPPDDRQIIHRVIYDELVNGICAPSSKQAYVRIIADLIAAGSEAIILGCTEIMLLVDQSDSALPVFDTTRIHAETAARWRSGDHRCSLRYRAGDMPVMRAKTREKWL
jgi:aspartate racemase